MNSVYLCKYFGVHVPWLAGYARFPWRNMRNVCDAQTCVCVWALKRWLKLFLYIYILIHEWLQISATKWMSLTGREWEEESAVTPKAINANTNSSSSDMNICYFFYFILWLVLHAIMDGAMHVCVSPAANDGDDDDNGQNKPAECNTETHQSHFSSMCAGRSSSYENASGWNEKPTFGSYAKVLLFVAVVILVSPKKKIKKNHKGMKNHTNDSENCIRNLRDCHARCCIHKNIACNYHSEQPFNGHHIYS